MTRLEIIDGFWRDVKEMLIETHNLSSEVADEQIEKNKHIVTDDGVGEAIIHFGPPDMAEGIIIAMNREKEQ